MTKNWRHTISSLKELLNENQFLGDTSEITEHIQSLLEYIVDQAHEQNAKKCELEELTINYERLKHRYRDVKKQHLIEMRDAIESAKLQTKESIDGMKLTTELLHAEMEDSNQRHHVLKRENEVLLSRSADAKRMWPELCDMMCVTMRMKARMQIKVNETRCRIEDARQKVVSLDGDVERLKDDTERYMARSRIQGGRIKEEANSWKGKISDQDVVTSQAKSELTETEDEVKWSKSRNDKATIEFQNATSKLESRRSQVESLRHKIASKRREKKQQEIYVTNMAEVRLKTQREYDEKALSLEASNAQTLNEARGVFNENESLAISRETKREELGGLRDRLKTLNEGKRVQRGSLLEANHMMNTVVGERASYKSEKSRLKDRLVALSERRDQMERIQSINLMKMTSDLQREQDMKENAERDWLESAEELHSWRQNIDDFYNNAYYVIENNREIRSELDSRIGQLKEETAGNKARESGLQLKVSDASVRMENMQKLLENQLSALEESVTKTKAEVDDLRRRRDDIEPNYYVIVDEFGKTSKSYKLTRDHLIDLNRGRKEINDDIQRKNELLRGLEEPRAKLRDEIREVNEALLRQMEGHQADMRDSGREVYELIKLAEQLGNQNKIFHQSCQELNDDVQADLRDIDSAKRDIEGKVTSLKKIRSDLERLISEEDPMTMEAVMRDDIQKYEDIKTCADNRGQKLSGATSRLQELISKFANFNDVTPSDDDITKENKTS